jgi:hypothetical protein
VVALLARYYAIGIMNVRVDEVLRRTDLMVYWYTTYIRVFLKCRKVLLRVNVFCKEIHILPHLMINMWWSNSKCQTLGWCVALFNVCAGWPRNVWSHSCSQVRITQMSLRVCMNASVTCGLLQQGQGERVVIPLL